MGGRHQAQRPAGRRQVLAQLPRVLRPRGRRKPRSSTPPASWSLLGEAGGVAAVAVAVGAVLLRLGIVVDWREPMLGAVLLLTPVLVRHVALGARHRWVALPCAYVVLAVCGYLIGRLVEPAWPVTAAGFLGAAGGALLGGAAFALISHFGGPTAAIEPAGDNQEPVRRLSYGPRLLSVTDEDTDTLPEVGALRDRDERGS